MVTPDGRKVYVSSDGVSTVSVIDTSIDVGANPHGLAVSGDGSRVLVLGWGSNRALIIDTATDRVGGEVSVAQPHNGTLSRDGRTGWVASQQQQSATALVRVELTTWKEVARVPVDKTPRRLEMSPDGRHVFFTLASINAIQVLDTGTRSSRRSRGCVAPLRAIYSQWSVGAAVAQGPGELAILDTTSNTVAATVAVGKTPHWGHAKLRRPHGLRDQRRFQ